MIFNPRSFSVGLILLQLTNFAGFTHAQTTHPVQSSVEEIRAVQEANHAIWRAETTPKANHTVVGRVFSVDNQPLSQATVNAVMLDISTTPSAIERHRRQNGIPPTQLDLRVSVRPDGTFKLEGLKEGMGLLTVSTPGHVPLVAKVEVPTTQTLLLQFEKNIGATVRGRVLDAITSAPIEGAVVRAIATRPARLDRNISKSSQTVPLTAQVSATQTTTLGQFEFTQLPAGELYFMGETGNLFQIPEQSSTPHTIHLEDGQSTVVRDLLLYPGFSVSGTLSSSISGAPVQGASLRMVNVFSETKAAKPAISDSEGSFTLRAINPPAAMIRQAKSRVINLPITIHRLGYEQGSGNIEIPLPVDLAKLSLHEDFVITPKNINTSGTTATIP